MADDVVNLRAERDFLLARSSAAGSCRFSGYRWTGMSSNALVSVAFGRRDNTLPRDSADLAACYRTVQRLPQHLVSPAVLAQLEHGERSVGKECVTYARWQTGWPRVRQRPLNKPDLKPKGKTPC